VLRDRYRPLGRLGAGESTVTYFAQDREGVVDNDCAIEQLYIPDAQVRALSELEVQRLQDLSGKFTQIPKILEYHFDGEYLYVMQSLVRGQNLAKYLEFHGVCSEAEVIDFLNAVLPILEIVHEHKIIHRNLKLEHIIRRSNGELVLTNFGVDKQSTGNIFAFDAGTPGYTPFEHTEQGISNPASDLYSLGAACFHLLTGKHPSIAFREHNYDWTNRWQEYLPRSISSDLGETIDRLLKKNYRERYQSAKDVSRDLSLIYLNIADNAVDRNRTQNLAASMSRKMRSRTSTNSGIDVNASQASVASNSLVEVPQDRKWMTSNTLLFGGLVVVAVALLPTIARQSKSLDPSRTNSYTQTINPNSDQLKANASGGNAPTDIGAIETPQTINSNSKADAGGGNAPTDISKQQGAIETSPRAINDAKTYFRQGNIRANSGDKKGAIKDYDRAIVLNPNDPDFYSQRGNAYSAIGKKKEAIENYTQIINLNPDRVDAYFHRAIDRFNSGDKSGAIEDYDRVIQLEPNRADAYFDRGKARSALGDKQGAIEDLTRSIQLKPDRAAAYQNRASARAALGDKQGATDDNWLASKLSKK
jgi:serine/threonine protein kinase